MVSDMMDHQAVVALSTQHDDLVDLSSLLVFERYKVCRELHRHDMAAQSRRTAFVLAKNYIELHCTHLDFPNTARIASLSQSVGSS